MYDITVVGAGPTGLAASIYCALFGMRTLVLESKKKVGGRVLKAGRITNYPGFPGKVTGQELVNRMTMQAEEAGAELHTSEEAVDLFCRKQKGVETNKDTYYSTALILATGAGMSGLNIQGETWIGDGISYCVECSEPLLKEMDVIVIGNIERAVDEALYLSKIAKHVTFINQANSITVKNQAKEKLRKMKVVLIEDFVGEAIGGEPHNMKLTLHHLRNSTSRKPTTNLIHVASPTTSFVSILQKAGIATHRAGCIIADAFGMTNIDGVFAAGSCASTMKDIIPSCVGDGTMVAASACLYVKNKLSGHIQQQQVKMRTTQS
jgi:thioredoxin reductase (NADPH)